MPTYEYQCRTCSQRFERVQRFTDAPITECPQCGGEVRRVIHPAGVIFKGSGWYITDNRKGGESQASGTSNAPSNGEAKSASTESGNATTTAATTASSESKPAEKTPAASKD